MPRRSAVSPGREALSARGEALRSCRRFLEPPQTEEKENALALALASSGDVFVAAMLA